MSKKHDDELDYINKHEMSRRDFMLDMMAMGGLAAGMSLPGMSMANITPPDDEVVRIGYLPITDATALLVAHGMGFLEEEGLKTEKPTLIRGWSPLVEGFAAGKFNLVHLLKPIPVWMRYNNDFPVKVMSWAHINGSALVVGKHVDAEDFKDLGGKQIAVPYWYSMHNIVLQMGLRSAGLKPVIKDQQAPLAADEVNLMIMPPPDMPPALAARKIDAFIVAEPFNAFGELKAGGKMLRFTGDMWKNHPCCVVCMNENTVNAKPEWTQKVMNAIVRAEVYAQQNKEEVAVMMSRDGKGYLPMPAEAVVRAMTFYDEKDYAQPHAIRHKEEFNNGRIDFSPFPYPSATEMIVEAMNDTLVGGEKTFLENLDPQFVSKDLVDYKHVKAAMAKYPGWETAPGVDPSNPYSRTEVVKI
ncbi:MAG: ABC transporter substrate-binding protein [Gammaproteobacteria bacterium]|nr:ABC transporter substrate-binding protein [Gammaproteobacteria bacterium]